MHTEMTKVFAMHPAVHFSVIAMIDMIGMLEKLSHGWSGRLVVLALLGFAATDFVITAKATYLRWAVNCCHGSKMMRKKTSRIHWTNTPSFVCAKPKRHFEYE